MDDKDKDLRAGNEALAEGEVVPSNLSSADVGARRAELVDDELPGFKVNDYSGEGVDAEGVGSDSEGATVGSGGESGVVSAGFGTESETVGAGPVENVPVAYGEGSISADISINGKVGGSGETALKTAVNGVELTSEDMIGATGGVSGVNEILRAETSGVDGVRITEAEARAMLIEDNARAKEDLKKARNKGKKTLIAVIIIGVVLVIAGAAVSIILGGMSDKDGSGDKHEENGGNAAVVEQPEKPEEPGEPEEELVGLALDDEFVQRLYGNFGLVEMSPMFGGWREFYINKGVKEGKISREMMMRLAGANFWHGACTHEYEYGNGGVNENECASGEAVRRKIVEMFGEQIELQEGDKLSEFCGGMIYDVVNDEFHQVGNGCGGMDPSWLVRILKKAEKTGNRIYLYEKVALFIEERAYHLGEDELLNEVNVPAAGEIEGFVSYDCGEDNSANYEEYTTWVNACRDGQVRTREDFTRDNGDQFKWTFEKNEEGNYVFKGLERVK